MTALCLGELECELCTSPSVVKLCIRSVFKLFLVNPLGLILAPREGSKVVYLVGFGTETLLTLSVE